MIFYSSVDVSNMDQLERVFGEIGNDFGRVDNWFVILPTHYGVALQYCLFSRNKQYSL